MINCSLNGNQMFYVTEEPSFELSDCFVEGENVLTLELVDMDHNPLSEPVVVTRTINYREDGTLPISAIQYTTAENGNSPYAGQSVSVRGTVTAIKMQGS